MRNPGPDEAQAGIKTAGRNINNLRYADDTTFMKQRLKRQSALLIIREMQIKTRMRLSPTPVIM